MRTLFAILAAAGWIWTIGFLVFLWVHGMNRKRQAMAKGFEVVKHE